MNELLRDLVHYGIHFVFPIIIAGLFYRNTFKTSTGILLAGIFIDIDHLWANPIFDPDRCSIGFHTLHQWPFILLYALLLFFPRCRIFGIALLLHIFADMCDCLLMNL